MPVSRNRDNGLSSAALVGLVTVWSVGRTSAEPVLHPDLTDRVGGSEDVTFADLGHLVPRGPRHDEVIGVRDIGGAEVEYPEPASAAAPGLSTVPGGGPWPMLRNP